jgi:hypothetical protein
VAWSLMESTQACIYYVKHLVRQACLFELYEHFFYLNILSTRFYFLHHPFWLLPTILRKAVFMKISLTELPSISCAFLTQTKHNKLMNIEHKPWTCHCSYIGLFLIIMFSKLIIELLCLTCQKVVVYFCVMHCSLHQFQARCGSWILVTLVCYVLLA